MQCHACKERVEVLARRGLGGAQWARESPKLDKNKILIYQKIIFLWAKSKDDILDIMCLNLFELKIIISTLKITSKSNL